MPEDLGSLMGSSFTPPDTSNPTATPGKKKLKKVGDHWEDEAGVKYADPEGNVALKMDEPSKQTPDAKTSAMDVQSTGEFGQMLKDNPGRTGSLMTGQLNPEHFAQGGGMGFADSGKAPEGMSTKDVTDANTVLQAYPSLGPDKTKWFAKWNTMTEQEKKDWLARAKKQMGG